MATTVNKSEIEVAVDVVAETSEQTSQQTSQQIHQDADPGDIITRAFQTNDMLALEKRTKMLKVLQGLVIEGLEIHHMHAEGSDAISSAHQVHDAYLESYEVTGVGGPTLGLAVTMIVKEPGVEAHEAKFVRRVYDFHQLFPTGDWKTVLDEDTATSVASGSTSYYSTSVEEEEGEGKQSEGKEGKGKEGEEKEKGAKRMKKEKRHEKEGVADEVDGEGGEGEEEEEGVKGKKKKKDKNGGGDDLEELLNADNSFDEPSGSSGESTNSDDSLQRIFKARNQLDEKKKGEKKKNRKRGKK